MIENITKGMGIGAAMRTLIRLLIGIVALFSIVVGVGFLILPARLGAAFSLSPLAIQGLATLRADFTGFFIGAGVFALVGAYRHSTALFVPIVLIGCAFLGRCVSLSVDGVGPAALAPMVIEALMLAILVAGKRILGNGEAPMWRL